MRITVNTETNHNPFARSWLNRIIPNKRCVSSIVAAVGLALSGVMPAFADNAVKLKVLVVATGIEATDVGLAYIRPVLDEMGVPYDILNSDTTTLTAATLTPGGCTAATAGCVGNYNGVILTVTDLFGKFDAAEWVALHNYEREFAVRESVLSGYPGYWCNVAYTDCYYDYGMDLNTLIGGTLFQGQWNTSALGTDAEPSELGTELFEYVNKSNPLPITDFALATKPRDDGTVTVTPLLTDQATGKALVSRLTYPDGRDVLLSTITNASFFMHSLVPAYEFVNYATRGVHVGGRFVHMTAHSDDLFIPDQLWDPANNRTGTATSGNTNAGAEYRLTGADILNAVSAQAAFRAAHPTATNAFKLDFPYNGMGAVIDPTAAKLVANLNDGLVAAVVANKSQFRFINHTFTHQDMDKVPDPPNRLCDYDTLNGVGLIQAEITKNRQVAQLLGLSQPDAALVSGNHSGLKDRKCTDYPELHPEMANVQDDDVPFPTGANPRFFQAMADAGVDYIASDSSQLNQNVEKFVSEVNDGSGTDRIILPRYPTNLFYNVFTPEQWVSEYNYVFYYHYVNNGQPVPSSGIPAPRDYAAILAAEADTALRHMLSFKKWPHYFHQTNIANYGTPQTPQTLQFDWLNAVFTEYEKLFKLPVKNYAFNAIGDKTRERLTAQSAILQATWNRVGAPTGTTCNLNQGYLTLSANKSVPNLVVTGVTGGDLYGGQLIWEITTNATPTSFCVDRALTQ